MTFAQRLECSEGINPDSILGGSILRRRDNWYTGPQEGKKLASLISPSLLAPIPKVSSYLPVQDFLISKNILLIQITLQSTKQFYSFSIMGKRLFLLSLLPGILLDL